MNNHGAIHRANLLRAIAPLAVAVICLAAPWAGWPKPSVAADLSDRRLLFNLQQSEINEATFQRMDELAADRSDSAPHVGVGVILSYFAEAPERVLANLRSALELSRRHRTPLVVQLDGEQWWQARPDLWNWWDASQPGYDPANAANVEWCGWGAEHALKLAWRNWGRQLRVLPPPNLMSPKYRAATYAAMAPLLSEVIRWRDALPREQRHLLVGVKVGWESSLGTNAYYYPRGNDLIDRDPSNDPDHPLQPSVLPGRGFQPTGYAAVATAGLSDRGELREADIVEVIRRHLSDLARVVQAAGLERERIFTHCGGWKAGELLYQAALNEHSCPGWSFYRHAGDPGQDHSVMHALAASDAPYWAAVEWLAVDASTADEWQEAIRRTLSADRCRYLCVYNWRSVSENDAAMTGIRGVLISK